MAKKTDKIEFQPDAWSRFERAVEVVAKSPPQHSVTGKSKANPKKHVSQNLHCNSNHIGNTWHVVTPVIRRKRHASRR